LDSIESFAVIALNARRVMPGVTERLRGLQPGAKVGIEISENLINIIRLEKIA
jgi:hypothetical protein